MKLLKETGGNNAFGLLGKGVEVTGDVVFTDQLQVEGRIIGKLTSEDGTLVIEQTAVVEAEVEVPVCVVRGVLNGNVNARSRIEIHKSSRVRGDLITPVLLIEEGAVFNGTVGMSQEASIRVPADLPLTLKDEKIGAKGA